MKRTSSFLLLLLLLCIPLSAVGRRHKAAHTPPPSALDRKTFPRHWVIEAEDDLCSTRFMGDTLEITCPKGLTLWRKEKMKGNVTITYSARVMDEGMPGDRLSDLNCFWMASDPKAATVFGQMKKRGGKFTNCYALRLYYVGFGGNHNTTTRFRRYDGNEEGTGNPDARPAILKEYTDPAHLLLPNRWYRIRLQRTGNRIRYFIDDECLVDYTDPHPLTEGWFGFRTTWSRTQITGFTYKEE